MEEAERIARDEHGSSKMAVISGTVIGERVGSGRLINACNRLVLCIIIFWHGRTDSKKLSHSMKCCLKFLPHLCICLHNHITSQCNFSHKSFKIVRPKLLLAITTL